MTAATTTKRIPLLDLEAQHRPLRDELLRAMTRVMDSQHFIMGPEVKQLEQEIATYTGVARAVSCASGSDALYLALLAAGVGPGDVVLTTPFSFFATAGSISRTGARPVFVDIQPDTFNIDPERLAAEVKKHSRVKAIIPVHLFGACADMDPILKIAAECGAMVIEDGAQSIGAQYKGRQAQSIGDIGCISFFPSKNLGGFGDGGMVLTNNTELADKLASLRLHGTTKKYYHPHLGTNSRLDTLQAAILLVKLPHLDSWSAGRARNAAAYREILGAAGLPITLPVETSYQTRHVYNQFVIRCPRRDDLKAYLQQHGVGTEVYYPLSLHQQPCYADLGYADGSMPVSEQAAKEVLALPIHADVSDEDILYICDLINSFYAAQPSANHREL
jgi:dTDP-4-amino-4,6-dideoxygalactose transaminase